MMALNKPLSGRMSGISGADTMCYRQANAAGLNGISFRAFLSDRYQSIRYLVDEGHEHFPVANFKVC